jgi:hypothetical protein
MAAILAAMQSDRNAPWLAGHEAGTLDHEIECLLLIIGLAYRCRRVHFLASILAQLGGSSSRGNARAILRPLRQAFTTLDSAIDPVSPRSSEHRPAIAPTTGIRWVHLARGLILLTKGPQSSIYHPLRWYMEDI